ncbi:MAG: hypothetical protein ACREE6_18590, partial [Limisphaerales bacterium]
IQNTLNANCILAGDFIKNNQADRRNGNDKNENQTFIDRHPRRNAVGCGSRPGAQSNTNDETNIEVLKQQIQNLEQKVDNMERQQRQAQPIGPNGGSASSVTKQPQEVLFTRLQLAF